MPRITHSDETSTGAKIVRNTLFGALRVVLVAPVPLLLTPFIIKHMGTQGLGLWALFLALNNLASLADLGFLGTLTKHVSEYSAKQDYQQLNRVISSGLLIFAGAALIVVLLLNLGGMVLISIFFKHGPFPPAEIQHAFRLLSLSLALNLLAFPFFSIITGRQQLGFSNLIAAVNAIGMAAFAALFLAGGFGVAGMIYAILASAVVNLGLSVAAARYVLPEMKISLLHVRRKDVGDLFRFSVKIYITQIAVVVHNHTEKFLLAHFSGLSAAGAYDIANDLSLKTRGVSSLLLSPLVPAATELQARDQQQKTLELYLRSQKYLAVIGVLIITVVGVLAHRFVQVWLGNGYQAVATALITLTAVQSINLATGPGLFILIGRGELGPGVRSATIGMILNLVLSAFLIARFGFAGAVIGTAIALSLASVYFVVVFHHRSRYPFSLILNPYVKPVILGALLAFLCWQVVPVGRLGFGGMAGLAFALTVAYFAGLILAGFFDAFDVVTLQRLVPIRKVSRGASGIA